MKPDTFERSRLAILTSIIQRATSKSYGGKRYPAYAGFVDELSPQPGDLVRIESCSASKWYLSWFVEMVDPSWNTCMLASIEDRSVCKWSNIGISVFDRDEVHPEWRWTDRQWDFWKKWQVPKRGDRPHLVLPCMPEFDGDRVTLSTRGRWSLDPSASQSKTFDNWKQVTKKDMQEFYYSVVNRPKPEASAATTERNPE